MAACAGAASSRDQCLQCLEADSDYNLPPLPRFVHAGSERAVQPDID